MDDWLRSHLIETGKISEDGLSRRAKASSCSACHRRTLVGLDFEPAGMAVEIDSDEIDAVGEVLALAKRIPTYTLRYIGARWEIDYRMAWEITSHRPWPIYPQHRCGITYPKAIEHPRLARMYKRERRSSDSPPF